MTFDSWENFVDLLKGLSKESGYKPKKGEFTDRGSCLISPATYEEGTTRANKNVKSWGGWAALDIDDYECSFDEVMAGFKDIKHVCYSSASSSKEHPKVRIVIPCTEEIPTDKIKHFWYALNKEFNSLGDPQTKDLSRMYYIPAVYPKAYNFIEVRDGPSLNPKELMAKHEFIIKGKPSLMSQFSPEMRAKMMQHKKDSLDKSFAWTSYRDCPFVNQNLVSEYRVITETGWYAKLYSIMTSIATIAVKKGYAIRAAEIVDLCKQIDLETGGWYKDRPLDLEADRAIAFAIENCI